MLIEKNHEVKLILPVNQATDYIDTNKNNKINNNLNNDNIDNNNTEVNNNIIIKTKVKKPYKCKRRKVRKIEKITKENIGLVIFSIIMGIVVIFMTVIEMISGIIYHNKKKKYLNKNLEFDYPKGMLGIFIPLYISALVIFILFILLIVCRSNKRIWRIKLYIWLIVIPFFSLWIIEGCFFTEYTPEADLPLRYTEETSNNLEKKIKNRICKEHIFYISYNLKSADPGYTDNHGKRNPDRSEINILRSKDETIQLFDYELLNKDDISIEDLTLMQFKVNTLLIERTPDEIYPIINSLKENLYKKCSSGLNGYGKYCYVRIKSSLPFETKQLIGKPNAKIPIYLKKNSYKYVFAAFFSGLAYCLLMDGYAPIQNINISYKLSKNNDLLCSYIKENFGDQSEYYIKTCPT